jgi:hypothetical protein
MNVKNALTTVDTGVKNHAIPRTQLFSVSNLNGYSQNICHLRRTRRSQLRQISVVFCRDNQDVGWRLWVDVAKCNRPLIFRNYVSRNSAVDYLAKQTLTHLLGNPLADSNALPYLPQS